MKAIRIPAHKTRYHVVTCVGGPWAGKEVLFPVQDAGDPLSLPIRVGVYRGRYDMNSGKWEPADLARDELLGVSDEQ